MDFINSKSSTLTHYWIGLNDQGTESEFVWSDGTTYNRSDYHSWYLNEPNNITYDKDCVYVVNKTWRTENCKTKYSYICERPKGTVTCPLDNYTIKLLIVISRQQP